MDFIFQLCSWLKIFKKSILFFGMVNVPIILYYVFNRVIVNIAQGINHVLINYLKYIF